MGMLMRRHNEYLDGHTVTAEPEEETTEPEEETTPSDVTPEEEAENDETEDAT